ncbi:MAG: PTS sugar transporter subunit IIA, partial [Opitutales bacterium]|nr:PTS sugar transporter subunit IIA [Opitutales bacterium]
MLLKKFLTKSRIIDITSVDFKGVLTELLATIPDSILGKVSRPSAMKELIERENAISTYLESGICVPHLRIEGLKQKYIFVVGRCDHKVKIRDSEEPKNLNTVFLLLSNDNVESYMETLSIFAKIFSTES